MSRETAVLPRSTDVLVVGAGPVGLATAVTLADLLVWAPLPDGTVCPVAQVDAASSAPPGEYKAQCPWA